MTPAKRDSAQRILADVAPRLNELAKRAFAFWAEHGPDERHGGFLGTLDREGRSIAPTDKGVIQQARHLWTLSMWYARREQSEAVKKLADKSYAFLIQHYLDKSDSEFRFKVSESGKVVDPKKQLYAESFAIYALATYGQTFDVAFARAQALACFRSIDKRTHDAKHAGYDQRKDPGWLAQGAEKGTNTHIHLLEAFTTLWEVTHDEQVGARLDEMIEVTATKLFQPSGYVHKEFLVDFTPHAEPVVSYGHDLETVWLLTEAARVRENHDERVRNAAISMGRHSSERGFDPDAGGFFYEGVPGAESTNRAKVWWVQFEALAGLFRLWELTGDVVQLERLERTLSWLEKAYDDEYGEWFEETLDDGSAGPPGTKKGHEWKTGYHGLRALVFTADWAEAAVHTK